MDNNFLGQGWAFPPQLDATGDFAMAAHEEDIRQAIRIILGTTPAERVMRPDFGAGLHTLVFEPINTSTCALARQRVEEALINWEPRIDEITVRVTPQPQSASLLIGITYRVRATNTFYNLVYPFYLMEGKEP